MSTVICAAACSGPPQQKGGTDESDPVELDPRLGAILGSTPSEGALDEFWREQALAADIEYRPPRAVHPFAAGEVPDVACRDALPGDHWTDNAFYCAEDETIVFDADFVTELGEQFGHFAGVAVVAHEWGHHIASLRRAGQPASFSVQRELEADCLAGVFAGGYEAETGDVTSYEGFARTFFRLGSEEFETTSWFGAGEHGSPNQRFVAWSLGYMSQVDGLAFCSGYAQWQPSDLVDLGGWLIRPLPGTTAARVPGGLAVSAGDRLPSWRLTVASVASNGDEEAALRGWISDAHPGAPLVVEVSQVDLDGVNATAVVAAADGTHVVGLDARQLKNGKALVYDVLVPGSPGEVSDAAVFSAFQTMMNAAAWVCAPGQSVDPGSKDYDVMCDVTL